MHLVHVRLPLACLDRVGQAAVDMVLEQQEPDAVGGGRQRLDLLEDVEAVRLLLDRRWMPRDWPSIFRRRVMRAACPWCRSDGNGPPAHRLSYWRAV